MIVRPEFLRSLFSESLAILRNEYGESWCTDPKRMVTPKRVGGRDDAI